MGPLEGIAADPFRPGARLRGSKRAEARVLRLFRNLFWFVRAENSWEREAEEVVGTNAGVACSILADAQNQV